MLKSRRFSLTKKEILRLRLGLLQAKATAVILPLAAFLEKINSFKALQNVALCRNLARTPKRCMLTHCLTILSTDA